MKKMLKLLPYSLSLILILSGCNAKIETDEEDLFKYKNAYIGDNSAVLHIVDQTMDSEKFKGLELKTKEKPYGIILNYEGVGSERTYKRTVIYNATYLFALVQNVEWITFNFNDQEYKIEKQELMDWYGEDFSKLQSEKEIETLIQKNWDDDDRVNQLF